jgi:hypothetical protein
MNAKLLLYQTAIINTGTHLDQLAIFSTNLWFPVSFVTKSLQFKG